MEGPDGHPAPCLIPGQDLSRRAFFHKFKPIIIPGVLGVAGVSRQFKYVLTWNVQVSPILVCPLQIPRTDPM